MEWLGEHGVEAAALFVSIVALLISVYIDARGRRWRKEDTERESSRVEAETTPQLLVKPRFDLAPGRNRLVLEVTNLHSETAVRAFGASCSSTIEFDLKKEAQQDELTLDAILPQGTKEAEFGGFFCDFDSFVANVGLKRFERQLSQVDRRSEIERIRKMGFLKNGQASVGRLRIKWEYMPARINARSIKATAEYDLAIWEYPHGVFLSLHRAS